MATISVTVTRSDSFAVEFTESDIAEIADEVESGAGVNAAILNHVSAAADRRGGPSVSANFNPVRAAVAAEIAKRKESGQ
jgi:hypothetical protein